MRTLLRENPECVNVRDNEGRTPLHYPYKDTQHGEQIIELLIAHGADTNAKDNEGRTPADQMLQNGRRDLAEVLRGTVAISMSCAAATNECGELFAFQVGAKAERRGHSLLPGSGGIGKRSWIHACHSGVSRATVPAA